MSKALVERIPEFSPGDSRKSGPWIMGSPVKGNWTFFSLGLSSIPRTRSGLGATSQEGEGERMASSMSNGVLADDDVSDGGGKKREKSGSKFRNSVQSEPEVGGGGCNRSNWGTSNKAEKLSTREVLSEGGA